MRKNILNIPLTTSVFFVWCLMMPTAALIFSLVVLWFFNDRNIPGTLTENMIYSFLQYYDNNRLHEGVRIFLNNYLAVLVIVYFTPVVLWLRYLWQVYRKKQASISTFEKSILYLFPALFLIRQAVNIAVVTDNLSLEIGKSVILTLAGIILPHGLPELLVLSIAGAVGMEITRRLLTMEGGTRLFNAKLMGLLLFLTAGSAFVEVYFTPKVFAMLMN